MHAARHVEASIAGREPATPDGAAGRIPRVTLWRASGPVVTLLVTGLIELARSRGMPGLPLLLTLTVGYSVLVGTIAEVLISGAIATSYAILYYQSHGEPFRYTDANLARLVIFLVATPLVVSALGYLKARVGRLVLTERDLRRRAEVERARLLGTLESITDGFFALDREWRYTYVNHRAEELVGRSRAELLGTVVWESFPPLVGSRWEREYRRAATHHVAVHFEEYYPPLETWFETHAYPSDDGITIYMRSINERKHGEQALRTRAAQQAAIAAFGQRAIAAPDLQALMDDAVEMLAATLNVELVKVLELLPDGDELVMRAGTGWKPGAARRVGAHARSQAGHTLASGAPVIVEDLATETRFEGPSLLLEHGVVSGMSVIIGGHDQPFGVLGAHTRTRRTFTKADVHVLQTVANVLADAIERKRAEEALAESERRFRQLADNVHEVFYVTAARRARVLYVSPAYEAIWGRSRDSLYEHPDSWREAIHPDDRAVVERHLADGASGTFDGEYRIARADGTIRWIHDRSAPVRDRDGRVYRVVGIAEDVTQRREASLAASRLAASEAAVNARDEVLAVVAHDLRNPLGAIALSATLLEDPALVPERRARSVRSIRRAADRAQKLVQDLLDVARIESGQLAIEPRAVAAAAAVSDVCGEFQQAARDKAIVLESDAPDAALCAWGDRDRIVQALENLVANALKFTGAGGRIAVHARASRDDGVEFAVEDTGAGIAPEALPHVFDRFWRERPAEPKGLGLGLSIVKGIVTAHHGRVWAESTLGKGTTFHFAIPAAPTR